MPRVATGSTTSTTRGLPRAGRRSGSGSWAAGVEEGETARMGPQDALAAGGADRPRIRYVPAVGPRLRKLLLLVFALFALLAVDSVYLGTITCFEWWSGK